MTGLGRVQVSVLRNLAGYHDHWRESYWPGDLWMVGSAGLTIRVLDSLVRNGLVSRAEPEGTNRPAGQYRLTDAGRAEARRRWPEAAAAWDRPA